MLPERDKKMLSHLVVQAVVPAHGCPGIALRFRRRHKDGRSVIAVVLPDGPIVTFAIDGDCTQFL
jgi:hypothetical protein